MLHLLGWLCAVLQAVHLLSRVHVQLACSSCWAESQERCCMLCYSRFACGVRWAWEGRSSQPGSGQCCRQSAPSAGGGAEGCQSLQAQVAGGAPDGSVCQSAEGPGRQKGHASAPADNSVREPGHCWPSPPPNTSWRQTEEGCQKGNPCSKQCFLTQCPLLCLEVVMAASSPLHAAPLKITSRVSIPMNKCKQ